MSSMFEHYNVEKLPDQELEDKMNYLGKLLGVKGIQQKQVADEKTRVWVKYNKVTSEKLVIIADMEAIGAEVEKRKRKLLLKGK